MIDLKAIAEEARKSMYQDEKLKLGTDFAIDNMASIYEGSYIECAQYISDKVFMASVNAIDNPIYNGCINLYATMLQIILNKAQKENN